VTTYTVAFYEIDRAYGGPEEGGWWFDTGRLERIARTFKSRDKAHAYAGRANRLLSIMQRDLRDVGSVLYSGGRYQAEVWDGPPAPFYPQNRPVYS
jgi:hypothetical protein